MTSQRSHEDTNWRAALEEYRAAKDRAAGAFRPDAKTRAAACLPKLQTEIILVGSASVSLTN